MTERKFTPYAGKGDSNIYETRNGMRVKVAMVDCGKLYGYLETKTGVGHEWVPHYWCWRGGSRTSREYDLFDAPVKHTFCINLYKNGCISTHSSSVSANGYGHLNGSDIIGRKEISIEEGEGL
jgi:hypothetical protein